MIATLNSWLPAFDDCESWKVVSRKQKKSPFFNCRKQSFCGEPRGSERLPFQVCCPGPGSVSKESDSGPPLSFSEGIPGSLSESQLDILNDLAVTAFDRSLRVRARGGVVSGVPLPWRQLGPGTEVVGLDAVLTPCGGENYSVLTVSESLCSGQIVAGARATAGSSRTVPSGVDMVSGGGVALCKATMSASAAGETDSERHVSELPGRFAHGSYARFEPGGGLVSRAGDSERIFVASDGVTCSSPFNSSCGSSRAYMSYLDAVLSAPARATAAALVARCSAPSSSAVGLCMHAHGSLVHDACSNSWSDTVRSQGPTGRRCIKGGVSGPAEDLRPVSEVEAGVNFRPAGRVRGQVAGSLPRRQPGTGTRQVRGGVDTPSFHPEVSGIQFVSPGRGLDIRQSMGWTKVCSTTRSGIWVLKGNARARMLPENLDHLRVRWISRGTYETA